MLSIVVRDYRLRFFDCLRKELTVSNVYMFVYLMVMALLWKLETKQLIAYYFTIVLEFFVFLLSRMYGEGLSKAMFLCPLSEKDRYEYVKTGYWVRVGTGIILVGIAAVILFLRHIVSGYIAGLFFLIMIFYSMAINVYCPPTGKDEQLGTKHYPQAGYPFFDMTVRILGILTPVFLVVLGEEPSLIGNSVLGVLVLVTIAAAIGMMKKYYALMLFFSAEYEKSEAGFAAAVKQKNKKGRRG